MPTIRATARAPVQVRRELKRVGFWHATGLTWLEVINDEQGEIQALRQYLGHWGYDGKWTIAVLKNGEVWLLYGEPDNEVRALLHRVCPKGRSALIICPDGWIIDPEHMAARFRDPYSNIFADPSPRPR